MTKSAHNRREIWAARLHWLVVFLIILQYFSGDVIGDVFEKSLKGEEMRHPGAFAHMISGTAILIIAIIRLYITSKLPPKEDLNADNKFLSSLAKIIHWGLYGAIILLPITGQVAWIFSVEKLTEVHEILFNVMMFMVILHILGALYHKFILRDDIFAKMRIF